MPGSRVRDLASDPVDMGTGQSTHVLVFSRTLMHGHEERGERVPLEPRVDHSLQVQTAVEKYLWGW